MMELLNKIYNQGHHAIFEHCYFTFAISGISRACSHQLVRHRLASYAQQSQRHVKMKGEEIFVIPSSFDKKTKEKFNSLMNQLLNFYAAISNNLPIEDARFILPQAIKTNLVVSLNFRELLNIAKERLCMQAQWEIREVVTKMKEEVLRIEEFLGNFLEPKCSYLGYCPEEKTCGLQPKKDVREQDRSY